MTKLLIVRSNSRFRMRRARLLVALGLEISALASGLAVIRQARFCKGLACSIQRALLVIMVVRYHGPAIPGMIPQQISTFYGGCAINNCEDLQLAVLEPN